MPFFKRAVQWAKRTIGNKAQAYDPLQQGNGTGWEPEETPESDYSSPLSSETSSIDVVRIPAKQIILPPTTILGKYTYVSTIAENIIHLYRTAGGEQVIVKTTYGFEANKHRQLAGPSSHHPNMVQYIDIATLDGEPVDPSSANPKDKVLLLMEFSNGRSFQNLVIHALETNQTLPAAFCFHVLRSILDGLFYMQAAHGMRHADMHLGNVTFDVREDQAVRCLLIDFDNTYAFYDQDDWAPELASAFALTAREIKRLQKAFPSEVVWHTMLAIDARNLGCSADRIRQFRDECLEKAGGMESLVSDMPEWLAEYFGNATSKLHV